MTQEHITLPIVRLDPSIELPSYAYASTHLDGAGDCYP